jgi:hypothetical protein
MLEVASCLRMSLIWRPHWPVAGRQWPTMLLKRLFKNVSTDFLSAAIYYFSLIKIKKLLNGTSFKARSLIKPMELRPSSRTNLEFRFLVNSPFHPLHLLVAPTSFHSILIEFKSELIYWKYNAHPSCDIWYCTSYLLQQVWAQGGIQCLIKLPSNNLQWTRIRKLFVGLIIFLFAKMHIITLS